MAYFSVWNLLDRESSLKCSLSHIFKHFWHVSEKIKVSQESNNHKNLFLDKILLGLKSLPKGELLYTYISKNEVYFWYK